MPQTAPADVLSGAPAAQQAVDDVLARPAEPRLLGVVGPAGSGKSLTLRQIAQAWESAGVEVLGLPGDGEPSAAALIVDDAHLLDDAAAQRLLAWVTAPGARVVVARRPWPRDVATARLGAALAATRPPLVLGALDRAGVAARATRLLGARPAEWWIGSVYDRTAGSPRLTDRLIEAVLAGADRSRFVEGAIPPDGDSGLPLPAELVEQVGYAVDEQDQRVRELVLACALGAPMDAELLAPLLGLLDAAGSGIDELDELVERAAAAGLYGRDGRLIPMVATAVQARTPAARRTEIRRTLAEIELDRGGSVLAVARSMVGSLATGGRSAEVFAAAADEAARAEQDDAAALYEEAVRAGTPPLLLAARRAEVHLRAGDLDAALAQSDAVLAAPDAVEPDDAVRAGAVAASVLARRGLLARSAELYRWMTAVSGGVAPTVAVPVLIGTGALQEARDALPGAGRGPGAPASEGQPPRTGPPAFPVRPPTLLAGAEDLMASGMLDSVQGSPTAALSQLVRAAGLLESAHRAALLPDTPAALAALVGVHTGEFDVARSALERAIEVRLGGYRAQPRHRLLLGWIALLRGATGVAEEHLAAADADAERPQARDEFLAASLQVALARRSGDLGALIRAWSRAREAIVRHPVDLFVLHPLGELVMAATRLREQSWVRPHLQEATALLERLGHPGLWSAPLHWAQLQAAVLVTDVDGARRHTAALADAAGASRFAAAMAAAAPHWVGMLSGELHPERVEAAARGLHAVGLSWDGGKLAGQAAIRTDDRRAMTALLGCARALQAEAGQDGAGGETGRGGSGPVEDGRGDGVRADAAGRGVTDRAVPCPPDTGRPDAGRAGGSRRAGGRVVSGASPSGVTSPATPGMLSDREREVAALVVQGRTYKEIGEELFISAKTVEHHVARMRQRLGVSGRGELHARLRHILGT